MNKKQMHIKPTFQTSFLKLHSILQCKTTLYTTMECLPGTETFLASQATSTQSY